MNSAGPTHPKLTAQAPPPPLTAPQAPPTPPAPTQAAVERTGAFTGERPGWGKDFDYDYARHVAAYRHAATLVGGRRVLDAGCGEGFGTSTLTEGAAEVVGVDYSKAAIDECRRLWCGPSRPNLSFEMADLSVRGSFDKRFDVVLSFQVLEHIEQSTAFVRSLAERLLPGGVLVLTTPNRLRTVSENPYHVREYTADELRAELSGVFANVTIRGIAGNDKVERFEEGRARAVARILRLDPLGIRNLLPRSIVEFAFARLARLVRRRARPAGHADIVPEDFSITDDDHEAVDRALDLLAVCSTARA